MVLREQAHADRPSADSRMSDLLRLPVLPLRDAVAFPGIAIPVSVGRPASLAALRAALDGEGLMVALQQHGPEEDISTATLSPFGTLVHIHQHHSLGDAAHILIVGMDRVEILRFEESEEGFVEAVARVVEARPVPETAEFRVLADRLRKEAFELAQERGIPIEVLEQMAEHVNSVGTLADVTAFYLDIPAATKQAILETLDVARRIELVLVEVERARIAANTSEEIQHRVNEELGERQREMILREQMRAIQKELGEDDDDLGELTQRLAALPLPAEARAEVDRELRRLRRMPPHTSEHQVIRTYLEWVTELPWAPPVIGEIDLYLAQKVLDRDHEGLEDVKTRIIEHLAVQLLKSRAELEDAPADVDASPILLFVGPPGVGKTSIATAIAEALARPYVRVALGGARDEADIRGHRRTYIGAMPGRILQAMRQAGARNPVFLLDEVDKLQAGIQGDPAAALLEVLDPAQNHTFVDHYLGVPYDLSDALFIATANTLETIPPALLDRMEVIEFRGYTEPEKYAIARSHILPRQLRTHGLTSDQFRISKAALEALIREYTHESGCRQLTRTIATAVRKAARQIATGEIEAVRMTKKDVPELLGRPRVRPERARRHAAVGVATGMFYTPRGGDILFVEASIADGSGRLITTGHLGDVMRESAQAALSFAKARFKKDGTRLSGLKDADIHVHVPAGAIPKDGPSAGLTIATALVSVLSGRKVCPDVAMTGEITLTGLVLPVGGIREKLLGAYRAGIRRVILPTGNQADLEDVPAEALARLEICPVTTADEALELALKKPAPHAPAALPWIIAPEKEHHA